VIAGANRLLCRALTMLCGLTPRLIIAVVIFAVNLSRRRTMKTLTAIGLAALLIGAMTTPASAWATMVWVHPITPQHPGICGPLPNWPGCQAALGRFGYTGPIAPGPGPNVRYTPVPNRPNCAYPGNYCPAGFTCQRSGNCQKGGKIVAAKEGHPEK